MTKPLPSSPAALDPLIQMALASSARNDAEQTLDLLQEAMEKMPSSGLPYFLAGAELAQLGRFDEAEAAYARAVLLAPEFDMARYELGTLQFVSGKSALAMVTWQPLLERSDMDALKMFVNGYIELAADRLDAAILLFEQGMRANTQNAALNSNIGLLISAVRQSTVAPPQDPTTSVTPPPQAETHFLLSSYRQRGAAH
ncbi:hypothetical protein [Variovorax terrae]|uniref:Tetratricopeptide repeat protein n=1 Tax=Variovorax terrae TaxID=2923278 RepID=A0A9X1VWH5_9BURK|nr:hypothetical protein [Variovorax terrae]MCJ0764529.1 hypothetical protein [Variovorax terrae]